MGCSMSKSPSITSLTCLLWNLPILLLCSNLKLRIFTVASEALPFCAVTSHTLLNSLLLPLGLECCPPSPLSTPASPSDKSSVDQHQVRSQALTLIAPAHIFTNSCLSDFCWLGPCALQALCFCTMTNS